MYFSINIGFRIGDGYIEPKSSSERLLFVFSACALVGLISYMASRYSFGASTVSLLFSARLFLSLLLNAL